jgi:hypothetical protein
MASSSHLKPGEQGRIVAKVATAYRSGVLHKSIDVFTNDPRRPRVILALKVRIKEPVPSGTSPSGDSRE